MCRCVPRKKPRLGGASLTGLCDGVAIESGLWELGQVSGVDLAGKTVTEPPSGFIL